jgi:protein gp37
MHDIWNPWHGCIKKSEDCDHCYMYFLDKMGDDALMIAAKTPHDAAL